MGEEQWNGNGWTKYQKLVLAELERHSTALEKLDTHLSKIDIEIATLKVKAGVWGLMGGMIPVAFALLIEFLSKR